jgi:hypothetical protein
MVENRHFSSEYVQARRVLLLTSSILLFVSLPGVRFDEIPLIGVKMSGLSADFLLICLLVADIYFALQFFTHLHEETQDFARENQAITDRFGVDLPREVEELKAAADSLVGLAKERMGEPSIDYVAKEVEVNGEFWIEPALREGLISRISSSVSIAVADLVSPPVPVQDGKWTRFSSQIDGQLYQKIERAVRMNIRSLIDAGLPPRATDQHYRLNAERVLALRNDLHKSFLDDHGRIEKAIQSLESLSAAISRLTRVRWFRLRALEQSAPAILFATAAAHAIGKLWFSIAPSLPQFLVKLTLLTR